MKETYQYKIRLNVTPFGGIKTSTGLISDAYDKDFYINMPVYKTHNLEGYVNVDIDPSKATMERQFINPFFIELGFFENVESVLSSNTKSDNSVQIKAQNYGIDISN